jgi:hypothetical protein
MYDQKEVDIITNNFVAMHLEPMYGKENPAGGLAEGINMNLYDKMTKEEPDLMDGFFLQKDSVLCY